MTGFRVEAAANRRLGEIAIMTILHARMSQAARLDEVGGPT